MHNHNVATQYFLDIQMSGEEFAKKNGRTLSGDDGLLSSTALRAIAVESIQLRKIPLGIHDLITNKELFTL